MAGSSSRARPGRGESGTESSCPTTHLEAKKVSEFEGRAGPLPPTRAACTRQGPPSLTWPSGYITVLSPTAAFQGSSWSSLTEEETKGQGGTVASQASQQRAWSLSLQRGQPAPPTRRCD